MVINWTWLGNPVKITGFSDKKSDMLLVKISPLGKYPEMFYGSRTFAPLTMMKMINTDEKKILVELELSNEKLLVELAALKATVKTGKEMREHQRNYFKMDQGEAKQHYLQTSKKLEKEFDKRVNSLSSPELF